ncbi:MAG: threonine synthase [Hyphomicrobiales bacterium]|nr:threonine synthase [Hyphomicrobiales bacterium]
MNYISTRGQGPALNFKGALMAGLAHDGGLYMPEAWPQMAAADITSLSGSPYPQLAASVMAPFVADALSSAELSALTQQAYARFNHPVHAPLVQIADNIFVLELFHGPTLAFKDFAMQALALFMDRELQASGKRAVIIGATSGDTGAAAIEAFKGRAAIDVFIVYPHGRVSDVQRRQMTTVADENVHTLAVKGTFDDCQAIVKALFNDADFRERWRLSAVNSINWARIMAQIPYYFSAAIALGAPHRPVSFAVPTGNFGDVFAGYAAKQMGLPIERLLIATNGNDILVRTLETGRYEPKGVAATSSPSMDIQISSNFERLLFEAGDRDAARVRAQMNALKQEGAFSLSERELAAIKSTFTARRADEETVARTIRETHATTGYLSDPHTAVAIAGAQGELAAGANGPIVVLATAHPAKFPAAVERAAGVAPAAPERLRGMMNAREHFTVISNDAAAVASIIAARAGAKASSPLFSAGLAP